MPGGALYRGRGECGNGVTCTVMTWTMGQELKDCSNFGLYFGFCLTPFIGRVMHTGARVSTRICSDTNSVL